MADPSAAKVRKALEDIRQAHAKMLDGAGSDVAKILGTSIGRQIQEVQRNLDLLESKGSHGFSTAKNLQLLDDMIGSVAEFGTVARGQAGAAWLARVEAYRATMDTAGRSLGLDLARSEYARASGDLLLVGAKSSFGQLSDIATLQASTLGNLKRDLADGLSRGLDYRSLSRLAENSGIEPLTDVGPTKRTISVEQRGEMIARTEAVRIGTQLQDAQGEEAGLDWGRSFINWRLSKHHELCLWAEAMGWAPVKEHLAGPGLPPRHTNCGCNWQRGRPEWLTSEQGYKAHAQEFVQSAAEFGTKLPPQVFERLPDATKKALGDAGVEVGASRPGKVLPEVPVLGQFADLAEAQQWAEANHAHIKWDFTGAHVDTINPTLAQFDKLAKEFPEAAARLKYIGTYQAGDGPLKPNWWKKNQPDVFAHASTDGERIGLNPVHYKNPARFSVLAREAVEAGFWPKGSDKDPAGSVVSHEFGHQVEHWLKSQYKTAFLPVVSSSFGIVGDLVVDWHDSHKATSGLSDYATTNKAEAWAEGFASWYHTPKEQQTQFVKDQHELIEFLMSTRPQWTSEIKTLRDLKPSDDWSAAILEIQRLKLRFLGI